MHYHRLISFMCTAIVLVCRLSAQTGSSPETYVGKAGDIYISEKEFLERFEMLPSLYRHRKPQLDVAKMELMYSIIAEKLLAQEALDRKFDEDSVFQHAFLELRKLLARDQLYREEIAQKVKVTVREITKGVARAQQQVLTSFMFFSKEDDAKFVHDQIRQSSEYDRLQVDSTMGALKDTATVIWGDADPTIEEAAYTLKRGEVSPILHAGDGYYIIKCIAVGSNSHYTSMQPNVLHDRVESSIRSRKERALLHQFIDETLKGKTGYACPGPMKILTASLMNVYATSFNGVDSTTSLTKSMVGELQAACRHFLNDTLVVVGDTYWTVDEVVRNLFAKGFEISRRDVDRIPGRLNSEIEYWVHQELLSQEGIRRGLDQRPEVQKQLELWRQSLLAEMMKGYANRQVTITDAEVWTYLQSEDAKIPVPRVQVRELRTNTLDEMREALMSLEEGEAFADVIAKWSSDPLARQRKGLSEFFPITEHQPIGEIAFQMDPGQRYGPVRLADGISMFEVVAKEYQSAATDSSLSIRYEKAAQELVQLKQKRLLNMFLAQSGSKRGFTVFEDRLKKMPVTPVPMMTFRLLGFGGRMFEVPFVDKQLDWLNISPPDKPVLP